MQRSTVRAFLGWSAVIAVIAATALLAYNLALRLGLERMGEAARHRLDMLAVQLESQQKRFDYLPSLLEMSPGVFRMLDAPLDQHLRLAVNQYLHGIIATAGALNLYVLDNAGRCLAASDWNEPGTPVGADLAFRPYVRDALVHGRGRFYGVGFTSRRAGYFLSYALHQQGRQRGVATVKVDMEDNERAWRNLPGSVLLLDERGVVILSTRAEWKFRPVEALDDQALAEIAQTRQYGGAELVPLAWQIRQRLDSDAEILSLSGGLHLASTRRLNNGEWRLIVLDELAPLQATARLVATTTALAMAVLGLLGVTHWQRQRSLRQQLASRAELQKAYDSLEAKVAMRTEELRGANRLLQDEVEVRKAIEADLRATQNELVHAGKMAAMGQMSAGMVHELNQPLGAIRTLSDNASVLLDQARYGDVRANLNRVGQLVDRLGRLTSQLKVFAHKAIAPREAAEIQPAIAQAQFLLSPRLREQGVELSVDVQPPELAAWADEARLEQVLVNLMGNAIDAVAARPARRLQIEATAAGDRCIVAVCDSGPGIRPDILPRLFEPFVTTKPAGVGLGLGLMISAHIVREFGGALGASNLDAGGACFVIDLPLAARTPGAAT